MTRHSRRHTSRITLVRQWGVVVALLLAAACSARMPPALPATLEYPDFIFPAVPVTLQTSPAAPFIDRGWRYLQNDDTGAAAREFADALKRNPRFYPATAGSGYVALAKKDFDEALKAFDATLQASNDYVPAIVGRGQALLGLDRDADALGEFERAVALDGSLNELRGRVEVLRFRGVQDVIERARAAATAGRSDEARTAYARAIQLSPDSSFLYRELGLFERKAGDVAAALTNLRKAVSLDSSDAVALIEVGAILDERQDFDGALAVWRQAAALEPTPELAARIAATTERAREARLPGEFREIPQTTQLTRGQLAALIGVRLEPLLRDAPKRQEVVTDIRNHWASTWITTVVQAGVIDAFENHTFGPQTRVRRGEMATAVSRLLTLIAARQPELRSRLSERPRIADMSNGHLSYPAAAVAVSTGVMPLLDGQRFQVARQVTGAEALDVVNRLRGLAGIR